MPDDVKAVRLIEVVADEAGQRIANYLLARLKVVPKSLAYRILRSGEVRINSKRVEDSQRVPAVDRIRVPVRTPTRRRRCGAALRLPSCTRKVFIATTSPRGLPCTAAAVSRTVIESLRSFARKRPSSSWCTTRTARLPACSGGEEARGAQHPRGVRARDRKRHHQWVAGRFRNELQRCAPSEKHDREGGACAYQVGAGGRDGFPATHPADRQTC